MKTTVSVLLYRTQQKEIELLLGGGFETESKVEEQKRKLKLRDQVDAPCRIRRREG